MWNTIEIIAIVAECFLVSRFLIRYFGYKSSNDKLVKSSILFILLISDDILKEIFSIPDYISTTIFIIICVIFSGYFLHGNIFEKVMISALSFILFFIINLPVLSLFSHLTQNAVNYLIYAENISRVEILFITKILYFLATQIILAIKNKDTYCFTKPEWLIIAATLAITIGISLLFYEILLGNSQSEIIYIVITFLMAALNIIVFIFLKKISMGNKQKLNNKMLELQLVQEEKQMEYICKQYNETLKIRHDIKNYISCANALIKDKKYQQAEEYLKSFTERIVGTQKSYVHSSSSVINAIINEKFSIAENSGIRVDCIITCKISKALEFDLSIVLANIIDNAIEGATSQNTDPEILLNISEKSGYLSVVLKNSIRESVLSKNPKLHTKKADKKLHGIGLNSVREIVEKYDGLIDFYENNNMFIVSIMLKIL